MAKSSKGIYILLVFFFLIGIVGPHFIASSISLLSIVVVLLLFKNNRFLIVIKFALFYQWIQINIKIWYGNFTGLRLDEQFSFYKNDAYLYEACFISNIGLIAFALGLYAACRMLNVSDLSFELVTSHLKKFSPKKVIRFYILISIGFAMLYILRNSIGGLNTLVVAIYKLKWGFFVFTYMVTSRKTKYSNQFLIIVLFEIILGFTGYFSDFKDIIIYYFIAFSIFNTEITIGKSLGLVIGVMTTIYLGFIWTAVKGDYRDYLSGGIEQQKVVVTKLEALQEFINLAVNTDNEKIGEAGNFLLDRISYIEFFSFSLEMVPKNIEYQDGQIWQESMLYYLQPRLFFPDKKAIDDSEHTTKYTGVSLIGGGRASHSLGYMADAYIDFGPIFMHLAIFVLGFLMGQIYIYILSNSKTLLWGIIFTIPFFTLLSFYSFNTIKIFGNFLVFVIFLIFARKFIANTLKRYLVY